jgi:hypothetical protein
VLTAESLSYMETQGLKSSQFARIKGELGRILANDDAWNSFLRMVGIRQANEVKIVTEAALLGSILHYGTGQTMQGYFYELKEDLPKTWHFFQRLFI